jgi:hypothetical protein
MGREGAKRGPNGVAAGRLQAMELKPSEPPGHAKRKLRGLVSEIARLRAEGYTARAIHRALAEAGVKVAWATVQREVARLARPSPAAGPARPPATRPAATGVAIAAPGASSRAAVDVESFFDQHNTNPLFKKPKKGKA